MDLFAKTEGSDKASNVKGAQVMQTVINWDKQTIKHEIQNQHRDSEGDVIGAHNGHETIQLTPEEFTAWVTEAMSDATLSRAVEHMNPVVEEVEEENES